MGTAASTAWAPGVTFGHYTLLAKLATGGMAEIWLARQTGLKGFERIVVIKRIIESLSADESFVEMFLDEARIVVQLTHPNIVQVFDLGEFAGAYYIAMEYLAGEHLASLVRAAAKAHQPLEPQAAVRLVISALDGLLHAHGRIGVDGKPLNIIHRDISPQNIVLTWDGQVKLLDFGIARAANRATQTQGNQLKGKYAYMAPEQANGDVELDPRADVFGMGIVLWELVTFRRLHGTDDSVQILKALISEAPIMSAHARNPRVPVELSDIIDKALQKRREDRFADAGVFKAELEAWLKANGGGPSTAELAGMMQQLFSDRIAERKQLIENAAKGIATTTQVTEALKPTTNRSMPGDTGLGPRRGRLIALGAIGALLLVLIGGAVKILLGRNETIVAEVAPTPAAPIPATIVVETEPSGATITLDGTVAGTSPVTLKEERPGEHLIAATVAGHSRVTRTFSVKGDGESLVLVLSLPALPVEILLKADAGTGPSEVRKADAPRLGRLSLNTEPWTRVALNGKPLGDTPLLEVPLPAGRHRLKLVNEEAKINVAIEVEIKAGQLTKKVLRL